MRQGRQVPRHRCRCSVGHKAAAKVVRSRVRLGLVPALVITHAGDTGVFAARGVNELSFVFEGNDGLEGILDDDSPDGVLRMVTNLVHGSVRQLVGAGDVRVDGAAGLDLFHAVEGVTASGALVDVREGRFDGDGRIALDGAYRPC